MVAAIAVTLCKVIQEPAVQKSWKEAGRSTQGVRLLHLEQDDHVAAASVIPPEEAAANGNGSGESGLLVQ